MRAMEFHVLMVGFVGTRSVESLHVSALSTLVIELICSNPHFD